MKKVSIREAKAYLSRLLEQVSTGKISLHEAKSHLSRLAEQVGDDDEVVITRDGEAVALLVAIRD